MKTKSKFQPKNQICDGETKPRRSIPVAEVDEMLDRQAQRLAREPTLYDQRLELLAKLDDMEGQRDYHTDVCREFNFRILSTQKALNELNQAISAELQLDSLR